MEKKSFVGCCDGYNYLPSTKKQFELTVTHHFKLNGYDYLPSTKKQFEFTVTHHFKLKVDGENVL